MIAHNRNPAHAPIRTVVVPLLCRGVGGMPARTVVHQLRCAYDSVRDGLLATGPPT